METSILLSKIVANPTENTWAQAYSTLNLYIVLSVKSENPTGGIVTVGKDLLEKLQREYFSLEEKNLTNIKKSVENVMGALEDKKSVSIILATITDDVLYIIVAGEGSVVLKRNGKVAVVAEGTSDELSAFSGKLAGDDIVIFETEDFSKKITGAKLTAVLDDFEVSEISENLAPLIHENPIGSEAAIVLQYKSISAAKDDGNLSGVQSEEGNIDKEAQTLSINVGSFFNKFKIRNVLNYFSSLGTKKLIVLTILSLLLIFAGSIFVEKTKTENTKRQTELSEIITPAQKKFDEAKALAELNKGLALEELTSIKEDLESIQQKFKIGTAERKKLEEFIGKVEQKIGELGSGSTLSNQKMVYDKNVELVQFKEGRLLAVTSDGKMFLLSNKGEVKKEFDSKNKNVKSVAADDENIYVLGNAGITRTQNSGTTKIIIEDVDDTLSIDIFGTNVYGLSKTIDKYSGTSYSKSDYFKGGVTLKNPVSMAINGSVWILDGDKIRRFTRGAEDIFTVSGATRDISSNSKIFTSIDYSSIYVLDRNSGRIISLSKDGEVKNQYVSKELSSASSFAVDEEGKKIYVVISSKLYSFDL